MPVMLLPVTETVAGAGFAALGLGDVAVARMRAAADDAHLRARTGAAATRARLEDLSADLAELGGTLTAEDFLCLAQGYLASARAVWSGLVTRGRATYGRLASSSQ